MATRGSRRRCVGPAMTGVRIPLCLPRRRQAVSKSSPVFSLYPRKQSPSSSARCGGEWAEPGLPAGTHSCPCASMSGEGRWREPPPRRPPHPGTPTRGFPTRDPAQAASPPETPTRGLPTRAPPQAASPPGPTPRRPPHLGPPYAASPPETPHRRPPHLGPPTRPPDPAPHPGGLPTLAS